MTNAAHFAHVARSRGVYTGAQVAKIVKRSPETIARWRKRGLIGGEKVLFGDVEIFVYSETNLLKIKQLAFSMKPGRKKNPRPPLKKIVVKKRRKVMKSEIPSDA
jgi:hypothetical protein